MMKSNPILFFNLCIVVLSWIAWSFNYFLISFDVKNLGGNVFINTSLICFAGLTGKIILLILKRYLPSRTCIMSCLTLTMTAGFGLVFFRKGWMVSVCVALVEIGIGGAFTLCYFINTEYFPPLFVGFSLAVSQFGGRGFSSLSYVLSDLNEPIPMILLWITTGVALFSLLFLRKTDKIQLTDTAGTEK
jgi:hypothetical protein